MGCQLEFGMDNFDTIYFFQLNWSLFPDAGSGINYLTSFFYGVTQGGRCGCGFWIVFSLEQQFQVHWGQAMRQI